MLNGEENIGAALVELAGELAVGNVKLEQRVAGGKRHAVHFGGVPCGDNQAAAIGGGLDLLHKVADLVYGFAVCAAPTAPLRAIHAPEVAVFVCPFVPNAHAVFFEVADIGVAR